MHDVVFVLGMITSAIFWAGYSLGRHMERRKYQKELREMWNVSNELHADWVSFQQEFDQSYDEYREKRTNPDAG